MVPSCVLTFPTEPSLLVLYPLFVEETVFTISFLPCKCVVCMCFLLSHFYNYTLYSTDIHRFYLPTFYLPYQTRKEEAEEEEEEESPPQICLLYCEHTHIPYTPACPILPCHHATIPDLTNTTQTHLFLLLVASLPPTTHHTLPTCLQTFLHGVNPFFYCHTHHLSKFKFCSCKHHLHLCYYSFLVPLYQFHFRQLVCALWRSLATPAGHRCLLPPSFPVPRHYYPATTYHHIPFGPFSKFPSFLDLLPPPFPCLPVLDSLQTGDYVHWNNCCWT